MEELEQNRIDKQITNKSIDILRNNKIKSIGLPEYIYEDQENIDINFKITKGVDYNNLTCIFDCTTEKEKYIKEFKDKTLMFPANIKYLIVKGIENLDCNLDFSKAVDLEYLQLVNPSYTHYYILRILARQPKHFRIINNWPANLKYLILDEYNYPLDNLPSSLQYIYIPKNFNHPLNNLPFNLIALELSDSCEFSYQLNNLPYGIKYLKIGDGLGYEYPLDNLPLSLEILDLGGDEYNSLNNLPDSITHLTFGSVIAPIENLPSNLKELKVYYDKNSTVYSKQIREYLGDTVFPDGFETLKISYEYANIREEEKNNLVMIFQNKKIKICFGE